MKGPDSKAIAAGRWRAILPPMQWLRSYRSRLAARDVLASVTLAAYLLPGRPR